MLKEIIESNEMDRFKKLIRQKKKEIKIADKKASNYNGDNEDIENFLYDEVIKLKDELKNIQKGDY